MTKGEFMNLRNPWSKNLLLLVGLLLAVTGGGRAKEYSSHCLDKECMFLPLVSNPHPVRVFEYQTYGSREGNTQMIGDVITTSGRPVYNVQLEFKLYDRYSELVASASGETVMNATLPGEVNPFNITTDFDWQVWDEKVWRYEINVTGWSLESDKEYRPLTTNIIRTEETPFLGTWVDVEVRNDESLMLAEVYGTAWDLGQAAPSIKRLLSTCLAPGETAFFSEFLWGVQGIEVNAIQTAAQGVVESCDP
jgi:hypothetical protein